MNQPQVIFDEEGQPAFAVIPWSEYERLVKEDDEAALTDEELYDLAKSERGESFPAEVADRLLAGQNPVGVYREHRGMTQGELAAAAGIKVTCLSHIEAEGRTGSLRTLAALAKALDVSVDDLI